MPPSLRLRHLWPAADQIEYVRRQGLKAQSQASANLADVQSADFLMATKIKTPQGEGMAAVPFALWPAQRDVLTQMERDRLLVILKARQLGISWLACGYVLWLCCVYPGKTVLLFSQGQLEANELIERISFMYHQHRDKSRLPAFATENTQELEWINGSNVKSLPATKKAGRSFSASLVVFDEFAFMSWGSDLYDAAKPTVDDGGRLWIISSADGMGTPYHQFWQASQSNANGFAPVFLPWQARPSRDPEWRDRKVVESFGDTAGVLREYPENDIEAFTHATGTIFDVWSDGPDGGNVTDEAEYVLDAGDVLWAVDDGYAGKLDPKTGTFTADSHPRAFLLVQIKPDGHIDIFAEHYAVQRLQDDHIADVRALDYSEPDYAVVDSAAAELRGRLQGSGIGTYGKPGDIEESIKVARRMIAADANGWRRVRVHPRCKHLRFEMAAWRRDDKGKPVKAYDHGPSCIRYLAWHLRYDQ